MCIIIRGAQETWRERQALVTMCAKQADHVKFCSRSQDPRTRSRCSSIPRCEFQLSQSQPQNADPDPGASSRPSSQPSPDPPPVPGPPDPDLRNHHIVPPNGTHLRPYYYNGCPVRSGSSSPNGAHLHPYLIIYHLPRPGLDLDFGALTKCVALSGHLTDL